MLDGLHVNPGRAAAIGTALLGCGDPLGLTFLAQVGLELGKTPSMSKNALPAPATCRPTAYRRRPFSVATRRRARALRREHARRVFPSELSGSGHLKVMQHLNSRIGEPGEARF